ncbi:unnamed protein product [Camellia sinensis]
MAGDKPVATCLHRADDLLQQSMFRLDDEFRLEDEARDGEEDAGTASEEAVGGGGVTGGLLVVEGDESNAESIVVLVLENRSFDHMIGWMKNSITHQSMVSQVNNATQFQPKIKTNLKLNPSVSKMMLSLWIRIRVTHLKLLNNRYLGLVPSLQ